MFSARQMPVMIFSCRPAHRTVVPLRRVDLDPDEESTGMERQAFSCGVYRSFTGRGGKGRDHGAKLRVM